MVKEGRTWKATIKIPRDAGWYNMEVLVLAGDFESAVELIKRTWTKVSIGAIETSMYEAVVMGD